MEASDDLLVHNIMFDSDLFVNKKYSVHVHCSLSCSNNKLLLQFRVSARIEEPVNSAEKRKPVWMFQVPLSFLGFVLLLFCLSSFDSYLVSGELSQLWFIPVEMSSCATSECRGWVANLRLLPFCCDMAHLWIYNGSMRWKKMVFKAKCFCFTDFFHTVLQGRGLLAL